MNLPHMDLRTVCNTLSKPLVVNMAAAHSIKATGSKETIIDRLVLHRLAVTFRDVTMHLLSDYTKLPKSEGRENLLVAAIAHCYGAHFGKMDKAYLTDECARLKLTKSGTKPEQTARICNHMATNRHDIYTDPEIAKMMATTEAVKPVYEKKEEKKAVYPEGCAENCIVVYDKNIYRLIGFQKCKFTAFGYMKAGSPPCIEAKLELPDGPDITD